MPLFCGPQEGLLKLKTALIIMSILIKTTEILVQQKGSSQKRYNSKLVTHGGTRYSLWGGCAGGGGVADWSASAHGCGSKHLARFTPFIVVGLLFILRSVFSLLLFWVLFSVLSPCLFGVKKSKCMFHVLHWHIGTFMGITNALWIWGVFRFLNRI